MALPLPPGLTPAEVGFLCEMEHVTVIPRQRLGALELLSGSTEPLNPPFPASLPLWLALLLKRQRRANITPPPWLTVDSLTTILEFETDDRTAAVLSPPPAIGSSNARSGDDSADYLAHDTLEMSAPFYSNSSTAKAQSNALPYHWLEMGHILLTHAPDDFTDPDAVRRLLRDLQEVRMSKLRRGFKVLDAGGGVKMNGVGGMEIAEIRSFVGGVVDGLRRINRSREESRKENEMNDGENGFGSNRYDDDDDDDMQL